MFNVRRAMLLTIALVVLTIPWSPPATAHDSLIGSSPRAGAVTDRPPAEVVLRFSNEVLTRSAQVRVLGPDDNLVSRPARSEGVRVVTALPGPLAAGTYQVRWRVTSSDGHPISGSYRFRARTGQTAPVVPTATPTPAAITPTPPASPSSEPTRGSAGPSDGVDPTSSTTSRTPINRTALGIGLGLLAVATCLVAAPYVARRMRRDEDAR